MATRAERTSVQIGPAEHGQLLQAQLVMSADAGRRLTLAEVAAELLRSWFAAREAGQRHARV